MLEGRLSREPEAITVEAASPGCVGKRRTAFATYVLPEVELLVRVARTLTAHPAGADALVQDTLVLAYQSLPGFDGRSPRIWLLTLMGHVYGTPDPTAQTACPGHREVTTCASRRSSSACSRC